jgi:RNA polymerase sigma factor (sigma-70 family)
VRFARWDPAEGRFVPWAGSVARNLALDHLRRTRSATETLGVHADTLSDDAALDALEAIETAALIDDILCELGARGDAQAQKVLTATQELVERGHDATHAAIADWARVSVSTVRRAVLRIRVVFQEV